MKFVNKGIIIVNVFNTLENPIKLGAEGAKLSQAKGQRFILVTFGRSVLADLLFFTEIKRGLEN